MHRCRINPLCFAPPPARCQRHYLGESSADSIARDVGVKNNGSVEKSIEKKGPAKDKMRDEKEMDEKDRGIHPLHNRCSNLSEAIAISLSDLSSAAHCSRLNYIIFFSKICLYSSPVRYKRTFHSFLVLYCR